MAENTFKKIVKNSDYKLSSFSSRLSAYLIAVLLPQKHWYMAAYRVCSFMSYFSKQVIIGNLPYRYQKAFSLNRLLSLITRTGKSYPIPIIFTGKEHLLPNNEGLIICSVHLPLVKAGVGILLDEGLFVDVALAALPSESGVMPFWGTSKLVKSLKTDANVLLKIKSILKEKGNVLAMIDSGKYLLWKSISPNMMHFCGKVGSRVVFLFVSLTDNHVLNASIVSPPFPYCKTNEEVEKNVEFMRQERDAILLSYKATYSMKG